MGLTGIRKTLPRSNPVKHSGCNLTAHHAIDPERKLLLIGLLAEAGACARGLRGQVTVDIARTAHRHPRTISGWVRAWRSHRLPGLARKVRFDAGRPRSLNEAGLEYLAGLASQRRGAYDQPSVRAVYQAYLAEALQRSRLAGKKLTGFQGVRYRRYLDRDGRLKATAQLNVVSYETVRGWLPRVAGLGVRRWP